MTQVKKVYICSRYRADERHTVKDNIDRAYFACGWALDRGYAPFAPHLIYPHCLDDDDPMERQRGILSGMAWLVVCDEVWQWGATVSEGMAKELALAQNLCKPIRIFNSIGIPKERWNQEEEGCNTTAKLFYPSAATDGV